MNLRNWIAAGSLALTPFMLLGCSSDLEVEGVVRDAETHRPIEGAMVQVGTETTRSDDDGEYDLEDIEGHDRNPVPILVTAPGYEAIRDVRHVDADDDDEAYLDFNMRRADSRIETTTTTTRPAGTPRTEKDNRVTVEVKPGEHQGVPEVRVQTESGNPPTVEEKTEQEDKD